jgi:hypothetical protein
MWSLADASVPSRDKEAMTLPLETAMKANELKALGDAWIATRPPLVLSVLADMNKPRTVRDQPHESRR